MEKELLSVNELAAKIKLSPKTIYGLVCRGQIPYLKVGARVLFDQDKIAAWLKSKERAAV